MIEYNIYIVYILKFYYTNLKKVCDIHRHSGETGKSPNENKYTIKTSVTFLYESYGTS